jgi:hypothetical protein
MYSAGVIRIGIVALLSVSTLSAQSAVQERATSAGSGAASVTSARAAAGVVVGTAWRNDTTPYAQARLRLRNVTTGRAASRSTADSEGHFRFEDVDPGPYVVELVGDGDRVLALSDLFAVTPGEQIQTVVRLSTRTPWFGGFFGNVAAAAIAPASTLGITATGSNGQPISAQ